MPTFTYIAKDRAGNSRKGQVEAVTDSAAAAQIREMGLYIVQLRSSGGREPSPAGRESVAARLLPPVSVGKRTFFWRQLNSLLAAGVATSESLSNIASLMPGHLGRIVKESAVRTAGGEPLSAVLAGYPATFPRAEVALIRAGEESGTLPMAVGSLADMNEKELQIRRDFMTQLAYPCAVLVVAAGVVLLLKWVTEGRSAAGELVAHYYGPAVLAFAALFFGLRLAGILSPGFKVAWDRMKIKSPAFGGIVTRLAAAKAANAIAAGYRSGLNLALSLELAADSCGNAAMARQLRSAVPAVQRGEGLTSALAETRALPPRALQLLATGEKTGDVDAMMTSASRYFTDEAHAALKLAAVVISILVFLVAAVVVLFVVLHFYQNLYGNMMKAGGQ